MSLEAVVVAGAERAVTGASSADSSGCCKDGCSCCQVVQYAIVGAGAVTCVAAAAINYFSSTLSTVAASLGLAPGTLALVPLAGLGIALWKVYKNPNLERQVQQLKTQVEERVKLNDELAITVEKTQKVASDLQVERDSLKSSKETLAQELEKLNQTLSAVKKESEDRGNTIALLQEKTSDLEQQVSQLQDVLKKAQSSVALFNEKNSQLKGTLEQLFHADKGLGSDEVALDLSVTEVNQKLGGQLQLFAQGVETAQKTSSEIIALLTKQNSALQDQVAKLSAAIAAVKTEGGQLGTELDRLEAVRAERQQTQSQISQLKEELQALSSRLEAQKTEIVQGTKKEADLSADMNATVDRLAATDAHLSGVVEHLADVVKHLNKQPPKT